MDRTGDCLIEKLNGSGMAVVTRKKDNDLYLWGGIIAIGFYFVTRHEWAQLAAYLPVIFFVLAWFFLFVMPTQCRYPKQRNAGPCTQKAYGIIFGCRKDHRLLKARAKLGIGRQESPSPARSHRRRAGDHTRFETYSRGDEAIPVRVEETRKDRISFRLGVLTFVVGLVMSAGSIVHGAEEATKWIISLFG